MSLADVVPSAQSSSVSWLVVLASLVLAAVLLTVLVACLDIKRDRRRQRETLERSFREGFEKGLRDGDAWWDEHMPPREDWSSHVDPKTTQEVRWTPDGWVKVDKGDA